VLKPWPGSPWRSALLKFLDSRFNFQGPGDKPGATVDLMRQGDVGAALSVLYAPFDEMDLDAPYGAPPRAKYVQSLHDQIALVEKTIAADAQHAGIARTPAELQQVMSSGRVAIVHCIEGGFALGETEAEIAANVKAFADSGVAYITLAHLFYRGMAQNAPALPFLPDWLYKLVFPQKSKTGLTPLGQAAVRAMVANRVLVDVTHMNDTAIDHTFEVLGPGAPVIASHIACRLGDAGYNLRDEAIREIGRRGGVIGVIACEHWAADGLDTPTTFAESLDVIDQHVKRIYHVTGSYDHIAIGSDIDGFIKPTLPGLEHMGRMKAFQEALVARYDATLAEKFCSANLLRVLNAHWH
jgi:microsomal dipeptidase-like Zn-dependent dipeptidase